MEKIFQKLASEGISPNQHYVLWSIRIGISPSMVNAALEMRGLSPEWIENGKLTGRTTSLLIEIDEMFQDKKTKNDIELMGKDYKEKIAQYRLLFPDKKLSSGKYARDSVKNMEPCFKWLFKNYEFDWDTIFKATEKYCKDHEVPNDKFHRTSKYFIKKQDKDGSVSSDLANYCEMIISGEGDTDSDSFHFSEKVV